ncbi:DNA polymerase III subunit beta [Peribacillus sp. FSL H8-0477]|uniref:DNA polymerase III subunit beta n=1 Tax=Peribacillus sp. FSL H8-0477 TaxID=2921388 RepID=UPI0030F8BAFA
MEFVIKRDLFIKAATDISGMTANQTVNPVLSGILLVVSSRNLTLVGSNSDIIMKQVIPVCSDDLLLIEEGYVLLPAKLFLDIMKKLPEIINVKGLSNFHIEITSGDINLRLNGLNPDDYPELPKMEAVQAITLKKSEISALFKQTAFAAAKNGTKPILCGINMSISEGEITCAATNSHRLASKRLQIANQGIRCSVILPNKGINALIRILDQAESDVSIFFTDSYMIFQIKTITMYFRLVEGNYPDVSMLIPKEHQTEISVSTKSFLEGIERASFVASSRNHTIQLIINSKTELLLVSASAELGEISERQMMHSIKNELDLKITFNGVFMTDALKTIHTTETILRFGGTMRPILITPFGDDSLLHIISPVRV